MATYKGSIVLVDMSEIADAGILYTWIAYADDEFGNGLSFEPNNKKYIGISYNQKYSQDSDEAKNPANYKWSLFKGTSLIKSETYYAISTNGVVPPVDASSFSTSEDGLLYFTENNVISLVISNNFLTSLDENGSILPLNTESGYITGAGAEWTKDIPKVPQGFYLWTKIIYFYSDGTSTVQFLSSYQGKDGQEGAAADQYYLEINQPEIIKFKKSNSDFSSVTTTVSPQQLTISVAERDHEGEGATSYKILDINNLSVGIYDVQTGVLHEIDQQTLWSVLSTYPPIKVDEEGKTEETEYWQFRLNLANMLDFTSIEAFRIFANNNCILQINYKLQEFSEAEQVTKTYNLTEWVDVRYNISADMATLDLQAAGIVAAIQDSKMTFNANGLTIENGALQIVKTENGTTTPLLYADELGNLIMRGIIYAEGGKFSGELEAATGTFSGTLTAATGNFSGEINANSGTIGGFIISENQLVSQAQDENGSYNIVLNGSDGTLEANNIIIGTGAQIKDYIKIGDITESNGPNYLVKLKRANTSSDSFLTVTKQQEEILALKADGQIIVGNNENSIIINGGEGYIQSQNYENGMGWRIANDRSIFNDVTVRGSIRASVLEYGETQAIGGALLVRPSTRIIKTEVIDISHLAENQQDFYTKLYVEETNGFNIGDYCRIDSQTENIIGFDYYEIIEIDHSNKTIIVNGNARSSAGKALVSFGSVSEERQDNVGISINGSVDDSFGPPQSISVFDFDPNRQGSKIVPKIVLGKLPDDGDIYGYAAGTYGLYAENVLLKGSLVTQAKTNEQGFTYSGISTLYSGSNSPNSDKYAQWFGENNTGEILLWAGAKGTNKEEIEDSKFFVDRNGNLFAGSGYFKGTIITDATITASAIETATIRGSGDTPALTIEDASKGIHFTATNELGESTIVFEVTKDHITANVPSFNFNGNFNIRDDGALVLPNLYISKTISALNNQAIIFDDHSISYTSNFDENSLSGHISNYIDFKENLAFFSNDNKMLEISSNEANFTGSLKVNKSIYYGDKIEYQPAYDIDGNLIGYDLYVE